jgi:uncharacterized protein
MFTRRAFVIASAFVTMGCSSSSYGEKLVRSAKQQIGETKVYDPAYVKLDFPAGDVPRDRGVCSDVVIRAYRDALGLDLQELVNDDMRKNFVLYPTRWGLKRPDHNIDHRRVPNLQVFFSRFGKRLPVSTNPADYCEGDLVTMKVAGRLPHIGIISNSRSSVTRQPLVIHNIGQGTQEDDILTAFEIDGHFAFWG